MKEKAVVKITENQNVPVYWSIACEEEEADVLLWPNTEWLCGFSITSAFLATEQEQCPKVKWNLKKNFSLLLTTKIKFDYQISMTSYDAVYFVVHLVWWWGAIEDEDKQEELYMKTAETIVQQMF